MSRYDFNTPAEHQVGESHGGFPNPLRCGYKYEITIRVKRNVETCRGANYKDMYERAKTAATDRINGLNCFRTCAPKRIWQLARQWDCGFIGNGKFVWATVKYVVLCPDTGQHGEKGLSEPAADAFSQPATAPQGYSESDFEKADEFIDIDYEELESVHCGLNVFEIRYNEPSADCASYNSQLKAMERNALTAGWNFAQMMHCPGACPRPIVAGLRVVASGCASDLATFTVQVIVVCA
jgi:hypothetical protein